jgi:hypothetical protein
VDVKLYTFFILVPVGDEWLVSCLCHFDPWENIWYPLSRKLCGTHSWSGCFRRKCVNPLRIKLWLGHGLDLLSFLPHRKLVNSLFMAYKSLQHHLKLCLKETKICKCHRCI